MTCAGRADNSGGTLTIRTPGSAQCHASTWPPHVKLQPTLTLRSIAPTSGFAMNARLVEANERADTAESRLLNAIALAGMPT